MNFKSWFPLDLLPKVRRPSRYINSEVNSVKKDLGSVALKFCLAFPDTYEVGISHLGLQILYSILNDHPEIACERVYAPWLDMEEMLKKNGFPLTSLESSLPLKEFDCIGFSLQYELSYTNVLCMLDLASIPFFARERNEDFPIIIGGGPLAYNPEPVADFFDAFCIGDGEELILELALTIMNGKRKGLKKKDILIELSGIEGVYVPSFFEVSYEEDGRIRNVRPLMDGLSIKRRVLNDLDTAYFPENPVVPYARAVHDRLTIEISRGCTRGCRFCQAGMIYRPVRERSRDRVLQIVKKSLKTTGYDDVSLLSLSAGDYTCIEDLTLMLVSELEQDNIALSFPSLRVGSVSPVFIEGVKRVRKTGFTLAPEAGTKRLRKIINKDIDEEDLIKTVEELFDAGWRSVKLYFMIGLPTETDSDLDGIINLAKRVLSLSRGRKAAVKVSVSTFVPKPHTPFQWEPMISYEEIVRRQRYLRHRLKRGFEFKTHDPQMSLLEGVFARGDRRLSRVILRAYRLGCRFDGWSEGFSFVRWKEAFYEEGLDMDFYYLRRRDKGEVFPWDHIGGFVSRRFLISEHERSLRGELSEDCRWGGCEGCGICDLKEIKNRLSKKPPLATENSSAVPVSRGGEKRNSVNNERLRLNYTKTGMMRFLSHLEMAALIHRICRRAGIPIVYSQGFHPLPRLSFAQPLPVGYESLDEYVDIEVHGMPLAQDILHLFHGRAPEGLKPVGINPIPLKAPSIQASVKGAAYAVTIDNRLIKMAGGVKSLEDKVYNVLNSDSFYLCPGGDGKMGVDIKPFIEKMEVSKKDILVTLTEVNGRSLRLNDLLAALLCEDREELSLIRVLKLATIFKSDVMPSKVCV